VGKTLILLAFFSYEGRFALVVQDVVGQNVTKQAAGGTRQEKIRDRGAIPGKQGGCSTLYGVVI